MATEKDKKSKYKKPIANMDMIGGNHKARDPKSLVAEGPKSYKHTVDKKLGTDHAKTVKPNQFNHIIPGDIGKEQPKPNQMKQEMNRLQNQKPAKAEPAPAKQQVQAKQPAAKKEAAPAKKPNAIALAVERQQQTKQLPKPQSQTQAKSQPAAKKEAAPAKKPNAIAQEVNRLQQTKQLPKPQSQTQAKPQPSKTPPTKGK